MLDEDLAELYEIEIRALNQAVKRNNERFPERFMFQITNEEYSNLKSQTVISSWGGKRTLPYAFTEQGVSMLSTVLRSKVAIEISIKVIDAFVSMRNFIQNNANIFQRLDRVELKQLEQDKNFEKIFQAIEQKKLNQKQGVFLKVKFMMHSS